MKDKKTELILSDMYKRTCEIMLLIAGEENKDNNIVKDIIKQHKLKGFISPKQFALLMDICKINILKDNDAYLNKTDDILKLEMINHYDYRYCDKIETKRIKKGKMNEC